MEDDVGIGGEEEKKRSKGGRGGTGRLQGRGIGLVDK